MDGPNGYISGYAPSTLNKDASKSFFVIPQTTPEGAELYFTLTDQETGTAREFHGSIAGLTWEAGKTYKYRVATSSIKIDYTFQIDASAVTDLQVEGGTFNLPVKSYKTISREGDPTKYVNVNWTTSLQEQYSNRSWAAPTNIQNYFKDTYPTTERGDGNFQIIIPHMTHSKTLETIHMESQQLYNDKYIPYNLASPTGSLDEYNAENTTANCYPCKYTGWVCFPAVYGTRLKDGEIRKYSYSGALGYCDHDFEAFNWGWTNSCSAGYPQHLHSVPGFPGKGSTIGWDGLPSQDEMYMYREYDSYTYICDILADSQYNWSQFTVKVDWQTGSDLITEPELFKDNQYIRFRAGGGYGNAVISLYDNWGNRVWSWHIWCTDQLDKSTDVNVTANGYNYSMAAVDLGWLPRYTYTYYDNDYRLQLTQAESGKTTDYIIVHQSTTNEYIQGSTPFWQFGRPAPFQGVSATMAHASSSPDIFTRLYNNLTYGSDYFINDPEQSYINIWSWDNMTSDRYTADAVRKSMYDPCPPGYCMPSGLDFMAFGFSDTPDVQPNAKGENPWRNASPRFHNSVSMYADNAKTRTVDFVGGTWVDNVPNSYNSGDKIYYLTSQGYVTFVKDVGVDHTFQIYYGADGKPYLSTAKPANIGGSIRPVREK